MKPQMPADMKTGFVSRLTEVLNKAKFPSPGRAARLAEKYEVTTSAAAAWLKGSVPSLEILVKMAKDFNTSVGYLVSGEENTVVADIDSRRLTDAVSLINAALREDFRLDAIPDEKLALLYELAYKRLAIGPVHPTDVRAYVTLASPSRT